MLVGYRWYDTKGIEPLFPFGHGLSYTTFELSKPRLSAKAIADGDFFTNEAYVSAMDGCKAKGAALHVMGLLSDGGVHSHIEHIFAAVEMAKRALIESVKRCGGEI